MKCFSRAYAQAAKYHGCRTEARECCLKHIQPGKCTEQQPPGTNKPTQQQSRQDNRTRESKDSTIDVHESILLCEPVSRCIPSVSMIQRS